MSESVAERGTSPAVEVLTAVFPHVPVRVLRRVLELAGRNLEAATEWILENDWRQILLQPGSSATGTRSQNHPESEENQAPRPVSATESPVAMHEETPAEGRATDSSNYEELERRTTPRPDQTIPRAVTSGRGSLFYRILQSEEGIGFLRSRRKARKVVLPTPPERVNANEKRFWVRFDDDVMLKTHLELLNINLKSCAHRSIALLGANASFIDEDEARQRLTKYSACDGRQIDHQQGRAKRMRSFELPQEQEIPAKRRTSITSTASSTSTVAIKGNELYEEPERPEYDPTCTYSLKRATVEACGRADLAVQAAKTSDGYWSHVFDIEDIDEVWRAMCSALIQGHGYIGDVFEIRSCKGSNSAGLEPFDVVGTLSRQRKYASVALVVPCEAEASTMSVVGGTIKRVLFLNEPLYYRARGAKEKWEGCTPECEAQASKGPKAPCPTCLSKIKSFYQVLNKEEHILASQYKLCGATPACPRDSSQVESSFRLRPEGIQHRDSHIELFKLAGVVWRPVH